MPVFTNKRKMSQASKGSEGSDRLTLIESEKRSQGKSSSKGSSGNNGVRRSSKTHAHFFGLGFGGKKENLSDNYV